MNSILVNLIKDYPDNTDATLILNDLTAPIIIKSNARFTYVDLINFHGEQFAKDILQKIKDASDPILNRIYILFITTGINLSMEENKDEIIELFNLGILTQDEFDKLTSLNTTTTNILEQSGLFGIKIDDVAQAMKDRIYFRDVLLWWINLYNTIFPQIQAGTITKEQIIALVNK